MDRKAFKQRMQELKSYREQNPGKGYLDWKASKYAEGGETPPTKYRGGYDKSGNIVVPVTNEDTITNVTTPQVTITPRNNKSYRLAERLMEDPDYIRRAGEVARKYGDDYLTTYADLLQAYDGNPNLFPKGVKDTNSKFRAQMTVKDDIRKAINKDGYVPGMGDFQYNIDTDVTDLSGNVTVHEMNHYVDFLKNKSPHADANSNMFYKMSEDMGGVRIDDDDLYYSRPTEQKAYMNQLREYMFENGDIARRGDRVSKDLLQKTLDRLKGNSKYDSVIRASKQFGNMTKYTKWFNSIPLLGIGALGVNKYFVNNEGENYDFRQER